MDAILKKEYDTLHAFYLDTVDVLEAFMVKRDTSSQLNQAGIYHWIKRIKDAAAGIFCSQHYQNW